MKTEVDAAGVAVGFVGRVGRIARAHQLGRGVGRNDLPRRRLLGLEGEDRKVALDLILQVLAHR